MQQTNGFPPKALAYFNQLYAYYENAKKHESIIEHTMTLNLFKAYQCVTVSIKYKVEKGDSIECFGFGLNSNELQRREEFEKLNTLANGK